MIGTLSHNLRARFAEAWCREGLSARTIAQYLTWAERYYSYCRQRGTDGSGRLTRRDVDRFARAYARRWRLKVPVCIHSVRPALHRWARALAGTGVRLPEWLPPKPPGPFDALIFRYRAFRRRWRGVRESSLDQETISIIKFLQWLQRRRQPLSSLTPTTVDRFLVDFAANRVPKTIAAACTRMRSFLRFLHAVRLIEVDLSSCIIRPPARRFARPPRVVPWRDIRRVLAAIDRGTEIGKRDFAAILLMASYGMGAGEVLGLSIDDIDWYAGTLRVVRPKTGVQTTLPLLGPVARTLASYLRASGARRGATRALFLRCGAPNGPWFYDGLRFRLRRYARAAGVPMFVPHALRRTHACRQIESAASPKVVSDICRDPQHPAA